MNIRPQATASLVALASLATSAHAQFAVPWSSIDCGGTASTGGTFAVRCVIGQHDAGQVMTGATFAVRGGFLVGGSTCPADLDDDGVFPGATPDGGVDINDLLFFLSAFEAGDLDADLDDGEGNGTPDGGVDINDLLFFLGHFETGC